MGVYPDPTNVYADVAPPANMLNSTPVLRVTGWNRPLLMQVSRRLGTEPPSSDVPIVAIDRAAAQGACVLALSQQCTL